MASKDTITVKPRKIQAAGKLVNRAVLVILSKKNFGKSFILNRSVNIVGRRDDCDIQITDPLASNRHCRIFCDDKGRFLIEDLESTNATYINDKILKKTTPLSYGTRIIVGNTVMRFFYEEEFQVEG